MGIFKKILSFVVIIAIAWAMIFTYNYVTDGFSIGTLRSTIPYYSQFDVSTDKDKENIAPYLNQKFRYLGKGCQFYVFASEDGQYVLKFLKHKHLRTPKLLLRLPLPSFLKKKVVASCQRREERVQKLFSSCVLCYRELKEESGLCFTHLHRNSCFNKKIVLIDKLGLSHTIAIDNYEFIVQKKGIDSRECFKTLVQQDADQLIRQRLQQLLDLITIGNNKKLVNKDAAFLQNVGFTTDGTQAMLLDVGQITTALDTDLSLSIEEEKTRRLIGMHHWALGHLPPLVPYIEELLPNNITP